MEKKSDFFPKERLFPLTGILQSPISLNLKPLFELFSISSLSLQEVKLQNKSEFRIYHTHLYMAKFKGICFYWLTFVLFWDLTSLSFE